MTKVQDRKAVVEIAVEVAAMLSEWEQSAEGARAFSERLVTFILSHKKSQLACR